MSPEEVIRKAAEGGGGDQESSKRPPGNNSGGVLHQRRKLPFSPYTVALGGLLIAGAVGYFTLYAKKKPEASTGDVAKVISGVAGPENTHPRK